jgi:hypothetical protein
MQELFGDMSFVAHVAGSRVVGSYSGPASHLLDIENNTINASNNSGSDLIAGNTGIVVMPGDDAASTANWATGVSSSTLQSVSSQLQSLESNFDGALRSQFAADHPFAATDAAASAAGTGFDIFIGNNHIFGGSGNSILIGNTALALDPLIGSGANGNTDADALQALMVTAVDRLFLGAFSAPTADAEAWGVFADLAASGATDWSSNGGFLLNDPAKGDITLDENTINTGNGSDHVYGHLAVILPQFSSSSGLVITFYAYPAGAAGQTGTANFDYVYNFGPFASLHH